MPAKDEEEVFVVPIFECGKTADGRNRRCTTLCYVCYCRSLLASW
jgi:hypothetical protein